MLAATDGTLTEQVLEAQRAGCSQQQVKKVNSGNRPEETHVRNWLSSPEGGCPMSLIPALCREKQEDLCKPVWSTELVLGHTKKLCPKTKSKELAAQVERILWFFRHLVYRA